jgi:hypothetical protein
MMGRHWCAFAVFVIAALAVCVASAPASAVTADYSSITIAGENKPALYLEFSGKELRMAPTLEGLAGAKPVKATEMNSYSMDAGHVVTSYQFPELDLPISMKGVSRIRAAISLDRVRQTLARNTSREQPRMGSSFNMRCRVTKKGADGADWTYVFFVTGGAVEKSGDLAQVQSATIAAPDKLVLTIETKIEGKKARIGLRVGTGPVAQLARRTAGTAVPVISIQEVLKNGKAPSASIEVTDASGKVVHTQKGDLKKFGFT